MLGVWYKENKGDMIKINQFISLNIYLCSYYFMIRTLLASEEMQQFDKARVFLDEDFTAVDKFTVRSLLFIFHWLKSKIEKLGLMLSCVVKIKRIFVFTLRIDDSIRTFSFTLVEKGMPSKGNVVLTVQGVYLVASPNVFKANLSQVNKYI